MTWFNIIHDTPIPYGESYPLFNRVSLETSDACNRRCSFCPVGVQPQKQRLMTFKLFTKILVELRELEFSGVIQLFLLNEPLLDPRLFDRLREIRDTLPKVSTYVSTNGDVLLRKGLAAIQDTGLRCLGFSLFDVRDNGDRVHSLIDKACKDPMRYARTDHLYRKHPRDGRLYLGITDMRRNAPPKLVTTLSEKGLREPESEPHGYCARPHRHIVIKRNGLIPMCCNLNTVNLRDLIVGDVNKQSLRKLWDSKLLFEYRSHLQDGRRDLPGCNKCTAKMAYAHVVRKVTLSRGN